MVLARFLLRISLLVALLLICLYLLPFKRVMLCKIPLNHVLEECGAVALTRARTTYYSHIRLRTNHPAIQILRTEMTCKSSHHRQGREAQHFPESLIIITHKQLNERRQFLRQFGGIPTLHEFCHFAVILRKRSLLCHVLRPCVNLSQHWRQELC